MKRPRMVKHQGTASSADLSVTGDCSVTTRWTTRWTTSPDGHDLAVLSHPCVRAGRGMGDGESSALHQCRQLIDRPVVGGGHGVVERFVVVSPAKNPSSSPPPGRTQWANSASAETTPCASEWISENHASTPPSESASAPRQSARPLR